MKNDLGYLIDQVYFETLWQEKLSLVSVNTLKNSSLLHFFFFFFFYKGDTIFTSCPATLL